MGETLRHAREDQNLTLEQVSRALHIRIRFLTALEASDMRALPSMAQSRGFLRMYAEHLGLDPAPLLARWLTTDQAIPPGEGGTEPAPAKAQGTVSIKKLAEKLSMPRGSRPQADAVPPEPQIPPRSTQLFGSIAERLIRQRKALEMSLEDAALISRINPQTLKLLEGMDLEQLPSPVIVRGLLLNYASALQMDGEEVLLLFADALQARRDERSAAGRGKKAPVPPPLIAVNPDRIRKINWQHLGTGLYKRFPFLKKYLTFDLLAGSILVLALVIVVIWAAASTLSQTVGRNTFQATLPERSEILVSGPTQAVGLEVTSSETPAVTSTATANSQTAAGGDVTQAVVGVQATYLITLPANADAAFRVTLRPLQTAFVQIWVDDRLAFRGRISPGADYPFNATRRVELLTGDASALRVLFNSTDMGVLGISGEVVHIIYTAKGVQTITPTVTSTFTPTPRPTLTPRPSATRRPTRTPLPTATPRP